MKRKDDLLLEQLYQEGILDRLRGQGSGLKKGAGTLLQKAGAKIAGQQAPQKSARVEYAKAQQTSLLNTFKRRVDREIADFNNDLKSFKVNPDPNVLEKDFPIIAQRLKEIENLKSYLSNPSATTEPAATTEPSVATEPSAEDSNKQFLQARQQSSEGESETKQPEEVDPFTSTQPTETATSQPEPTEAQAPQTQPTETQVPQPETTQETLKEIKPFKYIYKTKSGKSASINVGRDEQGWYQYLPKTKFPKKRLSAKAAQTLNTFLQEKEPTGSDVQKERAMKSGYSTVAAERAARYGESHNPFAEFLKEHELL